MDILSSIFAQFVPYLLGGALTAVGIGAQRFGAHLSATVQRSMVQDSLPQGGENEKPATSRPGVVERSSTSES